MTTTLYQCGALVVRRTYAAGVPRVPAAAAVGRLFHSGRSSARLLAAVNTQAAAASATPATPTPAAAAAAAAPLSPPGVSAPSVRLRPAVTSAQLRAQRPRATQKVAGNPDQALDADKCGPDQTAPEMVSVVNEKTGERMGPRGLEPTRFGDWEAKGRCWDF